jgi:hypothetical protein
MTARTVITAFLMVVSCLLSCSPCSAQECGNPWGGEAEKKPGAGLVIIPENIRLCLPPGFVPHEKDGGLAFYVPDDFEGKKGRLGLAVSADGKYRKPDTDEEYERIKSWLCSLANTSAGTSCTMTRLQGTPFVLLKGLEIGTHTESYFQMGDGYLLALSAEAPNEEALALLRAVIQEVRLP